MTAFAIPHPRRRKSKPAQVAKAVAKAWTAAKVGPAAAKTAKKGAKTVVTFKAVKAVGKRGAKLLVIPIAAGGGLVAYKKIRSSSDEGTATPYGSPVGPVATPATVTPPKTPGTNATANGEGGLTDPPAGAANPPASPPPGASS
jgi:hypothetical protein